MRPTPARSATARSARPFRARRRRRPFPWIFGGGGYAVPYVFTQPLPAPDPDTAGADATPDVGMAPDTAAPDTPATGPEPELGDRKAPARKPRPRMIAGAAVTIEWHEQSLDAYPFDVKTSGGGVYLVFDSTGPIYVGEADNFKLRWHKRLQGGYQAGVIGKDLTPNGIKVWFGTVTPTATEKGRQALESALIRVLINGGFGQRLRNDKQFNPIKPSTPIEVQTALPATFAASLKPLPTTQISGAARAAVEKVRDHNHLTLANDTVFELP